MLESRVETVAKSLGMSSVPESPELLRKEIRAELRDLHPDKNAGDFSNVDARERFAQLSTALAELDSDGVATSLVPLSTVAPMVTAIIEALGQAGQLQAREESPAAQRQAMRIEAREEAKHRFRLSRVGSVTIAALVSGLWMMPTVLAAWGSESTSSAVQASIIGPLFAQPLFEPLSFGIALYAWMFFALTWFMEQNDLARIDWVTTDQARGVLLKRAVLSARQRGDADSLTKADLRDAVGRSFRPPFVLRLLGARDVSASFLDGVVNQHVGELTAQRVLMPSDDAELSPRYVLAESVAADLKP